MGFNIPPKKVRYTYAKGSGIKGDIYGEVIGRVWEDEVHKAGTYRRVLDLIKWKGKGKKMELRFCHWYCKPNGTEKDFVFGQGAGNLRLRTFFKLIRKANTSDNVIDIAEAKEKGKWGTFKGVLSRLRISR